MANTRKGKPDLLYILKILWEHDETRPISKKEIFKELRKYGVILGSKENLGYKTLNRNLEIIKSASGKLGFKLVEIDGKGFYVKKITWDTVLKKLK